ncbi:MAG: hypothetical protein IJJ50_07575 [Lachnospiraceae bacterium]|nr:hypothetical protein [Lachnospiraceae bacterium]
MNEPFEQPNQGSGKRAGLIIVLILLALVLVLGALVGIRLGLPAFQKRKNGGQEETASREESSGGNTVAVVGAESTEGSSAAEKPPIVLPGIKTEEEAAESAAQESHAEQAAAEESSFAEQLPAPQITEKPEPSQPAAEETVPYAAEKPEPEQPAQAAEEEPAQPAPASPAEDDFDALKDFIAGYWECELTNEEKPYLYLYFSPDYSYKMGFKSDQRLTPAEIAKSYKQEITSVRQEDGWMVIDAFFIDGDLHTVHVKRDGDCIIYRRITGDEVRLTRMKED